MEYGRPVTRAGALLGSLLFLVVAPGTVAGLVPWWISRWRVQRPFLGAAELRLLGAVLLVAGVAAGSLTWGTALSSAIALVRRRVGERALTFAEAVAGLGLLGFGGALGYATLHDR